MKNIFNLFILSFFLNLSGIVQAADIVKWSLPQAQGADEEFLLYRLSYRGIYTAFAWKDLADTVIIADNKPYKFNKQKSCQLSLKMSTENFTLSELILPMRFHWRTTVSPDLKQIYLIEEINKNEKDSHQLVWLNQKGKQIEFYHKRKKIRTHDDGDFYEEEYAHMDDAPEMVWEAEGKKQPPDFLLDQLVIDGERKSLVYDRAVDIINNDTIFDPLSLIYSVRWHDYSKLKKVDFVVAYKDSFRKYHAHFEGHEKLNIGDRSYNALRIVITREKKEAEDDDKNDGAFMVIWLSDDERRIPLRYMVEASHGTVKMDLKSDLEDYKKTAGCIIPGSLPAARSMSMADGKVKKADP